MGTIRRAKVNITNRKGHIQIWNTACIAITDLLKHNSGKSGRVQMVESKERLRYYGIDKIAA